MLSETRLMVTVSDGDRMSGTDVNRLTGGGAQVLVVGDAVRRRLAASIVVGV
jgi:hypothetical protein